MRTFQESKKSQKTVESLKIDKNDKIKQENSKTSKKGGAKNKAQEVTEDGKNFISYDTRDLKQIRRRQQRERYLKM